MEDICATWKAEQNELAKQLGRVIEQTERLYLQVKEENSYLFERQAIRLKGLLNKKHQEYLSILNTLYDEKIQKLRDKAKGNEEKWQSCLAKSVELALRYRMEAAELENSELKPRCHLLGNRN